MSQEPLHIAIYFLHYLAIFAVVSGIVAAHLMLHKNIVRADLRRVWPVQVIVLGGFALAFVTGLLQWFAGEWPAEKYTKNGIFHLKVLLVVVSAALAVPPTLYLKKHKDGEPNDKISTSTPTMMCLRGQLVLVVLVIPLLALLMARFVGFYGE
ncbi:MAG: DUF2214 family protein [Opitutales bacterium]